MSDDFFLEKNDKNDKDPNEPKDKPKYPYYNIAIRPQVHWKGDNERNYGRKAISSLLHTQPAVQNVLPFSGGSDPAAPERCGSTGSAGISQLAGGVQQVGSERKRPDSSCAHGAQPLSSSLDNKPQSTTWNKKHKRTYSCALSGLKRCEYLNLQPYFLTLTTSPFCRTPLARDFDLFVKRIRRELGYKFEYMKVETSEGNGVIHAIFHSAFDGWEYGAIHAYISCLWNELHSSPIVWCSPVLFPKRVASYIVQYVAGQTRYVRKSCSKNWIFKGYRKKFLELIKKLGFKKALIYWDALLKMHSGITTVGSTLTESCG